MQALIESSNFDKTSINLFPENIVVEEDNTDDEKDSKRKQSLMFAQTMRSSSNKKLIQSIDSDLVQDDELQFDGLNSDIDSQDVTKVLSNYGGEIRNILGQ